MEATIRMLVAAAWTKDDPLTIEERVARVMKRFAITEVRI